MPMNNTAESEDDAASLEENVVALATGGQLDAAAGEGRSKQSKLGLPLTFVRGSQIIKEYPDGRVEVLGRVDARAYQVPEGVQIIGRK